MSRLKQGMMVTVYRYFAAREEPIGHAELVARIDGGLLPRGGQLEHWQVRYLDLPEGAGDQYSTPPESVTIRTDEPDLCRSASSPPADHGPRVRC